MSRDEALIEEAWARANDGIVSGMDHKDLAALTVNIALELERSGWQPPVDPDVLAVRDILASRVEAIGDGGIASDYRGGDLDQAPGFLAALAAYRKHKGRRA